MNFTRLLMAATAWLFLAGSAAATDRYASPSGAPGNSGSMESPWDLQTALNQPASVAPGDTIWLRGGTYHCSAAAGFASKLNGTAASPIIVRNYNGERATIDGKGTQFTIAVYGSYTWYWGLEIMDSNTLRRAPSPGVVPNSTGVSVYGPNNKFINLVVHDTSEGFNAYNQSPNCEFYGNLDYYNGFVGADRNHGHGMYMQNNTGTKLIADNIVGDNADEGLQIYGSGNASIVGFTISGNSLYNTSSWPTPNYQYNIIRGGGAIQSGNTISDNYSFFTPSANAGLIGLGQYTSGQNLVATNNVFAGGYITVSVMGMAGPLTFSGNKLYAAPTALRLISLGLFQGQTTSGYLWDNNAYFGFNSFYHGTYDGSSTTNGFNANLATWQSQTGFDAHSTFTNGTPPAPWIYIRPNKYEAKRANITIYNWNMSPTVSVDLSGVLSSGDKFVIQDAQNFYGSAVATGTYSGAAISIPMMGLTKATPSGFAAPAHTAPLYGTFVVMVPPALTAETPDPPQNFTATVE
jgi:hypothetical protein